MKKLRIRKIITALIVITWVPSSFASPSGISARSSSAASRRSAIATSPSVETPSGIFARSSSVEDSISIVDIDGKNQINFNFITGSNGQELVIFEHCQDGSCKPLGLEEGYSLEKLSSRELLEIQLMLTNGEITALEKLSSRGLLETWKILSDGSDEQLRELLAALQENGIQAGFLSAERRTSWWPGFIAVFGAVAVMGLAGKLSIALLASLVVLEFVLAFLYILNINRVHAKRIKALRKKALEEASKTLAPLFRD